METNSEDSAVVDENPVVVEPSHNENNISSVISESFIKELFIEMVDIKGPVNPILDEINIDLPDGNV